MTDKELIRLLRLGEWAAGDEEMVLAADRIEQLVKERDDAEQREATAADAAVGYLTRAEAAEAKLAKALEALHHIKYYIEETALDIVAYDIACWTLTELEKTE